MAEFVAVDDIKESLMECPVCTEILDNDKHSPKLLPCCLHAICTQCVFNLIAAGETNELTCPMCRKVHHLPGGANDLPVERVMTKMVDFLKILKGKYFPCTDCPDNGTAISHCKNCKTFMCQICENAHKRSTASRNHTIVSLQVIKSQNPKDFNTRHFCDQHPHHPSEFYCYPCDKVICVSCTIMDHNGHKLSMLKQTGDERRKRLEDLLSQLTQKTLPLKDRVTKLRGMKENINKSTATAQNHIQMYFKKIQELLNKRKEVLIANLNEVHKTLLETVDTCEASNRSLLSIIKSATDHTRDMMSKADCVETLDLYSATSDSLKAMIEKHVEDVDFTMKGMGFTPVNFRQIESLVEDAGLIRTVTFTPTKELSRSSVDIEPPDIPQGLSLAASVTMAERKENKQTITCYDCSPGERLIFLRGDPKTVVIKCPRLDLEPVTQSREISTSPEDAIRNNPPAQSEDDTGCQLKKLARSVFVCRTFVEPGKHVWQIKVHHKVKQKLVKNMMCLEIALTNNPVDDACSQSIGFSLTLRTPDNPEQLYIRFRYDGKIMCNVPAMKNEPGEEGHFDLVFLLEMDRKSLSILDLSNRKVLHTVFGIDTSKPLFSLFVVERASHADQTVKIVSGKKIDVTRHLIELLTKVIEV